MTTEASVKKAAPPKVASIRRSTVAGKITYGPPQMPIEDRAGLHMNREALDVFSKDALGRDVFSKESRIREWEETEALHQKNMVAPLPVNQKYLNIPAYGVHLLAGEMGSGKSLFAAWLARHYYRCGWPVYSTAGFLFGQRLLLIEAYAFPDHVTPGGFIFVDEVHTLMDRYSSNSVRSRTFGQSTTAMRKERVTCMGATANSNMVDWTYRGASECLLVPTRWYPHRGRKLHAPPFCHLEISKIHPFPYKRRDQILMDAGLLRGSTGLKIATWRPSPIGLMAAAKLIDSFESVRIGENFGIDASAMKGQREGLNEQSADNRGPSDKVLLMIRRVLESGYLKAEGIVSLTTVRDLLRTNGAVGVTTTDIRSSLEIAGCEVNSRGVDAEDLADMLATVDLGG